MPSGTNFDLFAGDLLLFDGLGFKTVTPYRAVDGQRYAFALRPAGMAQAKPLSSNTEDLKDGDFYTAFAMPGDGHGPHLRVVSDHLDSPASGKARLRVVHAGIDAGKVDVRAAGATDALFDDVDYQSVTRLSGRRADERRDSRSSAQDTAAPVAATTNCASRSRPVLHPRHRRQRAAVDQVGGIPDRGRAHRREEAHPHHPRRPDRADRVGGVGIVVSLRRSSRGCTTG